MKLATKFQKALIVVTEKCATKTSLDREKKKQTMDK